MQYVIIGNSITSVGCIESIRKHDTTGAITVIGEENHPSMPGPSSPTYYKVRLMSRR